MRSVDYTDAAKGTSFQHSVDADRRLQDIFIIADGVRNRRLERSGENRQRPAEERGVQAEQ